MALENKVPTQPTAIEMLETAAKHLESNPAILYPHPSMHCADAYAIFQRWFTCVAQGDPACHEKFEECVRQMLCAMASAGVVHADQRFERRILS